MGVLGSKAVVVHELVDRLAAGPEGHLLGPFCGDGLSCSKSVLGAFLCIRAPQGARQCDLSAPAIERD
eukprot:13623954-Alexandrium_andersonii.AAC.1